MQGKTARYGFGYPGTVQKVTAGAASAPVTNAFGAQTNVVRVAVITADVHFALDAAPTATTNDSIIPAGTVEYLLVHPGQKLAFIRAGATDATVTVTEMTA